MTTVLVAYPPSPTDEQLARLRAAGEGTEVLVAPYEEPHGRRIARGRRDADEVARHPSPSLTAEQRDAFGRAEAIMAFDVPDDLSTVAPNVRWLQGIGAGVDHLWGAGLEDGAVLVTNAVGVGAVPIAEFVVARLLAAWKRFDDLADQQRRHDWSPAYGRTVAGCTVGVVGLGAIGTEVAARCRALGMRVLAVRRNPSAPSAHVDDVVGPDRLNDVLGASDAVVVAAPSTDDTKDLFDADAFAAMRPGAVFVNVARGALVDEDALVAALASGQLSSAALDVTKQEPLPADSPLWDVPRLHLSPHSAVAVDRYVDMLFDLFADNLGRWLRGEPLRNVVDVAAGY